MRLIRSPKGCVQSTFPPNPFLPSKPPQPFVIVRIGANEARSHVCEDGHSTPAWGWKCVLPGTASDVAAVNVIDKASIGSDVVIGFANLSLAGLTDGKVADVWLQLKKGDAAVGEINVKCQLMRQAS